MPTISLPKFDSNRLFEKADSFNTSALTKAEELTNRAIDRMPKLNLPYTAKLPKLNIVSAEMFNRASKIQSANRVFVKRVFLGEVAPVAAEPKAKKAAK